jgi:hypothetical protein
LAAIGAGYASECLAAVSAEIAPLSENVGPKLVFASRSHLGDLGNGGVGGTPRMEKRASDKDNTEEGDEHFQRGDDQNPRSPSRDLLPGLYVAFGAVLIVGGLFLCYLGLKRASDAFEGDSIESLAVWKNVFYWSVVALIGGGVSSGVFVYGLSVCFAR